MLSMTGVVTPATEIETLSRAAEARAAARVWWVTLLACAIAVGVQAGFSSLSDPDLPSHLAIGRWIVEQARVPYTEPFAWTRAGEPYFAYSWLMQVVFYEIMRLAGPVGLHLLASAIAIAITLTAAASARALGSSPAAATTYGVASAVIAMTATPFLRPQLVMFALVPVSWLAVARARSAVDGNYAWLAVLFISNAVAAATHISFPVMAASLVLLAPDRRKLTSSRTWRIVAATGLGWLASPYAGSWVQVFRLNFASNALTRPPALSGEMTPGFVISPLVGACLAALPLIALSRVRAARERAMYGAMWLVGLVAFARMFKGIGPWWWCSMPLCVAALRCLPNASSQSTRRIFAGLLVALVGAQSITNVRLYFALSPLEGDEVRRTLPSMRAYAAEPAARWLERNMRVGTNGRLLTVFNYGSYLEWRLPSLSPSIDGRTIFPDSVALPDAIGEQGQAREGPWNSADLAIVPESYPVVSRLRADSGWVHVGDSERTPWGSTAPRAGLWVRRGWWARAGSPTASLPSAPQTLRASP
jgi:hypothetical protein